MYDVKKISYSPCSDMNAASLYMSLVSMQESGDYKSHLHSFDMFHSSGNKE